MAASASVGWLAPREPGFGSFIRRILESQIPEKAGSVVLQKHQLAVRKFLVGSPYRGLLVFHGLGSGKTCAAVSAVEALMATRQRVFVVLPASLQSNFEKEIDKCSRDGKVDKANISFVRMNGVRTTTGTDTKGINVKNMTVDGVSVHGSVFVVDEVHNLAGYKKNGGKRGNALYHLIYNARDAKVICLSGTVIVNSPFELGIILNMISGPQRTLRFRNPTAKSDEVRNLLDKHTEVASHYADGLTTVVRPVQEGYRRSSPASQLLVRSQMDPGGPKPHDKLRQEIKSSIGASSSKLEEEALFPEAEQDFEDKYVNSASGQIVNASGFQRAALGLVSQFSLTLADAKKQGFPDVLPERRVVLEMSSTMFERYNEQRAIEISMEKSNARRAKRTGDDQNGNFRSGSRMICNFAFAKRGARPFHAYRRRAEDDDDDDDDGAGKNDDYRTKLKKALDSLTDASLRGDKLRELSPKMAAIMKEIVKGPGPVLVYSNFRTMEGAGIMAKVLEAAGYSRLAMEDDKVSGETDHRKGVFHEFQGASENPAALEVFNGKNAAWNKKRGSRHPVDVVLITGAGAEGIGLRGVRQVHIMEPYWHEIRIQQVIGRAARLGSHAHLPERDRTVAVYRYAMKFAPGKQMEDQQLKRFDKNLTTDQYIDALSSKKAALAETFLSPLRSVAVDCGMYPESGACFGESIESSEGKNKRKFRLVEMNGVTALVDDSTGKAYYYADYKRDKKLVEINKSKQK